VGVCNIKMDLKVIGFKCVDWIQLAHDWFQCEGLVERLMKFRTP
jgi:hypothetical protein